jgi:outer membrane protein assembly factor BamB
MSLVTKMKRLFLLSIFLFIHLGLSQRPEFPPFVEPLWKLNIERESSCSSEEFQIAVVDKSLIYSDGDVIKAISTITGESVWQFNIACIPDFASQIQFSDKSVYILSDQKLHSIQAATGKQEWSYIFEKGVFTGFSYSEGWLFVAYRLTDEIKGVSKSRVFAFDALSGELTWDFEDADSFYFDFEVFGQTIKTNASSLSAQAGGEIYLDLSTGEHLWGYLSRGLSGRNRIFFVDENYGYRVMFHGGAPETAGPIEQFDIRTGKVLNSCVVAPNPAILDKRYTDNNGREDIYAFPFANRFYAREADGKWFYVQVGVDVHRLPLCGVTLPTSESSIETLRTRFGSRQGYYLSTLLFTLDWNYLTTPGEFYPVLDKVIWMAKTADDTFLLFYPGGNIDSYGLYSVDAFPKNYLTLNDAGGVSSVEHFEPITLKHYEEIYTSPSQLDIIDDLVFVGTVDGIFHVFDLHTQEVIFRTRVNSPNFAPFHLVDDIAIVETLNGEVMAFKLDLPNKQ